METSQDIYGWYSKQQHRRNTQLGANRLFYLDHNNNIVEVTMISNSSVNVSGFKTDMEYLGKLKSFYKSVSD